MVVNMVLHVSGLSDVPGEAMVKLYCPRCMDVYTPKSSRHHHTDGAYFGTGFPHMVFMVHPEYRPKRPASQFVPRSAAILFYLYLHLCFYSYYGTFFIAETMNTLHRLHFSLSDLLIACILEAICLFVLLVNCYLVCMIILVSMCLGI